MDMIAKCDGGALMKNRGATASRQRLLKVRDNP